MNLSGDALGQLLAGLAAVAGGGIGVKLIELAIKLLPKQQDTASAFRSAVLKELDGQRKEVARRDDLLHAKDVEITQIRKERDEFHDALFVERTKRADERDVWERDKDTLQEQVRKLEAENRRLKCP